MESILFELWCKSKGYFIFIRKLYPKVELAKGRRKYRFTLGKVWKMKSGVIDLSPGLKRAAWQ